MRKLKWTIAKHCANQARKLTIFNVSENMIWNRPRSEPSLKNICYLIVLLTIGASQCLAAGVRTCPAGTPVDSFRFLLVPAHGGPPLPVSAVNEIVAGQKLKYEPLKKATQKAKNKARIAVLLVPVSGGSRDIKVMDPQSANADAEWEVPWRASIVGLVYGPQGLDVKKVNSLVEHNQNLIPQLANYAQQATTVEALVQTLSKYEQSPPASRDLNAVLSGFSSQYNVALPQLNSSTPTDQQAATLMHSLVPALSSYNPLASERSTAIQQSAGLATWVAALFLGSTPVGLAAGGATLFQNMRTLLFPGTDFHAAFAQPTGSNAMELCTPSQASKSHTRAAYLWVLRVPDVGPPSVRLPETQYIASGWKSQIEATCATRAQLKILPRAREWQLVSSAHQTPVPVSVTVGPSIDTLSLNLSKAKIPPGEYHLAAKWDWTPFQVAGSVEVHNFGDLRAAKITPDSSDRLIEGSGPVPVELAGADFEFVKKVAIVKASRQNATAKNLTFTLPTREKNGEQIRLQTEVDTTALSPGSYLLMLTQENGAIQDVPITIHPPNPKIENLPLRANLGEPQQTITLRGTGLDRIQGITSRNAQWELAKEAPGQLNPHERKAIVKLAVGVHKGELVDASLDIQGIHKPLLVPDVIQVVGPRPKILSVRASFPSERDVTLSTGEIPAGSPVSFAIQGKDIGSRPSLKLTCSNASDTKQSVTLLPGERDSSGELDFAGNDVLFLSLIPGSVGQSGCVLTATVSDDITGTSDPYTLGRVIRLPRISRFTLTNTKLGDALYAGTLTGDDLQMIAKTGWDPVKGFPVQGIPTPVPGHSQEQTLRIEMPWPPPSPRAPVYIWLRGESAGRLTAMRY